MRGVHSKRELSPGACGSLGNCIILVVVVVHSIAQRLHITSSHYINILNFFVLFEHPDEGADTSAQEYICLNQCCVSENNTHVWSAGKLFSDCILWHLQDDVVFLESAVGLNCLGMKRYMRSTAFKLRHFSLLHSINYDDYSFTSVMEFNAFFTINSLIDLNGCIMWPPI